MIAFVKKMVLFINLIFNYGISPSTIFRNGEPLKNSSLTEFHKGEDKHGV